MAGSCARSVTGLRWQGWGSSRLSHDHNDSLQNRFRSLVAALARSLLALARNEESAPLSPPLEPSRPGRLQPRPRPDPGTRLASPPVTLHRGPRRARDTHSVALGRGRASPTQRRTHTLSTVVSPSPGTFLGIGLSVHRGLGSGLAVASHLLGPRGGRALGSAILRRLRRTYVHSQTSRSPTRIP